MNISTCAVFLLLTLVVKADGLYCYSCAGTVNSTPCVKDVEGLVTTRVEYEGVFSKDCDLEINQTMCVIETVESEGVMKSIIRGCSDGYTFSFNEVKLFRHLSPTNQTTCSIFSGQLLCITLCRQDYCNGPQVLESSSGGLVSDLACFGTFLSVCLFSFIQT